jgi:hypothetical protein
VQYAQAYQRDSWTSSFSIHWQNQWLDFLSSFKQQFQHRSSMQFPKLHTPEHIPLFVSLFGAPIHWKAMDCESLHKIAKQEGRNWNHQTNLEGMLLERVQTSATVKSYFSGNL